MNNNNKIGGTHGPRWIDREPRVEQTRLSLFGFILAGKPLQGRLGRKAGWGGNCPCYKACDGLSEPDPGEGWPHPGGHVKRWAMALPPVRNIWHLEFV